MEVIGEIGNFKIAKIRGVVIIERDGELFCNLRKSDPYFHNPMLKCQRILADEAEVYKDSLVAARYRRQRINAYLAIRAERAARQFVMEF